MTTVQFWFYRFLIVLAFAWLLLPFGTAMAKPKNSSISAIKLLKKIKLYDYGSHVVRFGDLNGDGQAEAVMVQIDRKRQVTGIVAISLYTGKVLWQHDRPRRKNFRTTGDIPVQVYDWNQDGYDDVIFAKADELHILNGLNGTYLNRTKIEHPYSLFIYDTDLFNGKAGLILQGRSFVSLLEPSLNLVWRQPNYFSHFPLAVDADHDGKLELLSNYRLFRPDGSTIWERTDLGGHNDSADYGDVNCDGINEIAIATSGPGTLLDNAGNIIWRGREHHAQHVTIGSFLPYTCERQVAVLDRDSRGSGTLLLYNHNGQLLWNKKRQGKKPIMSRVDGWTGAANESLLLVFRKDATAPVLINGKGEIMVRFSFPPAKRKKNGRTLYNLHFAQHFDLTGNGLEEIIIYNEKALWIYGNAAERSTSAAPSTSQILPNPRIYNATFYQGMQ